MVRCILFVSFVFVSIGCGNSAETPVASQSSVSGARRAALSNHLLQQLQQALNVYFTLGENFVVDDTAAINRAALQLAMRLNNLPLHELQLQDTVLYATVYGRPGDAVAELQALIAETDIGQKRASFEMISSVLYDLLKTLQPGGIKVYQQYCPMAFDDKGAYWLSATDSIRNPYFGKKMLHCGETKELLQW